jgi:hypothetical protein
MYDKISLVSLLFMFQEIHLDSVPLKQIHCHPRRAFPIHLHLIKDLGCEDVIHGCDVEVSTLGRVVGEWIVQWPCKPLTLPSLVVLNLHLHGPSWRVTTDANTLALEW